MSNGINSNTSPTPTLIYSPISPASPLTPTPQSSSKQNPTHSLQTFHNPSPSQYVASVIPAVAGGVPPAPSLIRPTAQILCAALVPLSPSYALQRPKVSGLVGSSYLGGY